MIVPRKNLVPACIFLLSVALVALFLYLRTYDFATYHRIVGEDEPVEHLQFVFFGVAGLVALWVAVGFFRQASRIRGALFVVIGLGLVVTAGEEIAWGQRALSIESPDYFSTQNYQREITLHNLLIFQHFMHAAYIATGGTLILLTLLPGRSLRDALWFLTPARSLLLYFVPVVVFHVRHEIVRLGQGRLVYPYDQEPAEFMLALGVMLFTIQVALAQRRGRA